MDPRNKLEALTEARLDEIEGADFLMVKPALSYLDVIHILKENSNLPVSAYNVQSTPWFTLQLNIKLNYENTFMEILASIKRAG